MALWIGIYRNYSNWPLLGSLFFLNKFNKISFYSKCFYSCCVLFDTALDRFYSFEISIILQRRNELKRNKTSKWITRKQTKPNEATAVDVYISANENRRIIYWFVWALSFSWRIFHFITKLTLSCLRGDEALKSVERILVWICDEIDLCDLYDIICGMKTMAIVNFKGTQFDERPKENRFSTFLELWWIV